MTELRERDLMRCRSCGQDERASEGYPCESCGTFICLMCVLKGMTRCATCRGEAIPGSDQDLERLIETLPDTLGDAVDETPDESEE